MESIFKVKEKGTDIHKEQSYFSSFIKKVMENIQVSVTNVHICYQDAKSTPNHIFAVGLTMDTLTVATTDSDWIPLPTANGEVSRENYDEEGDQVHKLVTFFNLAVYWDTDMGLGRTVDTSGSDVAPMLSVGIPRHKTDKERQDHQYLVEPLSGLLRATIKGSPDLDEDDEPITAPSTIPFVSASFGLKEVEITLQSNQYRDLLNLLSFLRDWNVSLRYVRFRPDVDVKTDPKAWWLFAFRAVRKELRKRSGVHLRWSELATRRNDRRAYIKIFKKKLLTHRLIRVERDLLNVLEKKLSYEDVVLYGLFYHLCFG
jgi:vacuolar protein sorting-associated protein 13A/C